MGPNGPVNLYLCRRKIIGDLEISVLEKIFFKLVRRKVPYLRQVKSNVKQVYKFTNKGYFMVGDILNESGEILTIDELVEKELYINFLDYFRIKKKINSYINMTGKNSANARPTNS